MDLASLVIILVVGTLLAGSAGIRAFLGPAAVSFAAWMEWVQLDPRAAWVGHPLMLGSLLVALVLEVLSDKVPILHHFLDMVHVVVKPMAGALVGATVIGVDPTMTAAVLAIVGGGSVAAVTHVTKAGLRVGSSAATVGAAAPVHSLVEDAIAIGLVLAGVGGMYAAS